MKNAFKFIVTPTAHKPASECSFLVQVAMRRLEVGEDFVEVRDCVVEKPPGEREQGKGGRKLSKVSLINVLHALLKGSGGL